MALAFLFRSFRRLRRDWDVMPLLIDNRNNDAEGQQFEDLRELAEDVVLEL